MLCDRQALQLITHAEPLDTSPITDELGAQAARASAALQADGLGGPRPRASAARGGDGRGGC